jgi:hypothetical protein
LAEFEGGADLVLYQAGHVRIGDQQVRERPQPDHRGVLGELGAPVGMTMDSLLVLLRNGHAYVNVHTRGPVNATTHSGGHGGGEIRGQVVKQ